MTPPDERAELIARLTAQQREVARALAPDRVPPVLQLNLTMQQLRVLVNLAIDGPAPGQALAGKLGVAPATLTGIVDRLIRHGLVVRSEDPNDRRIRRIALTPEGAEVVEKILDAGAQQFGRVLRLLDTETLRQFDGVMHKLHMAAVELREQGPP